jgi:hypothetical protein
MLGATAVKACHNRVRPLPGVGAVRGVIATRHVPCVARNGPVPTAWTGSFRVSGVMEYGHDNAAKVAANARFFLGRHSVEAAVLRA